MMSLCTIIRILPRSPCVCVLPGVPFARIFITKLLRKEYKLLFKQIRGVVRRLEPAFIRERKSAACRAYRTILPGPTVLYGESLQTVLYYAALRLVYVPDSLRLTWGSGAD